MNVRSLGALSVGIILFPVMTFAQAPPRDRAVAEVSAGTARLRGRVVAADTGTPLRRAQVRAVAGAIRTTRLTTTDAEGRYEFVNLPAARYTINVSKAGYVGLEFGQRRPFEGGRPMDLADAQIVEQVDFALPRGAVIAGRITDDAGDPIVGAWVHAMRYQYGPGGRRRLLAVDSPSWLSNLTNDLGELNLFGLMPGSYVVAAQFHNTGVVSLSSIGSQTGGINSIDIRDGFLQTYFPGAANVAEAQPVVVNLSEEAQASFALATGRMSTLAGIVRRSDGRPAAGLNVDLQSNDANGLAIGGGNSTVAADGSFSFANIPPGQYVIDIEPRRQSYDADSGTIMRQGSDPAQAPEFARVSATIGGSDQNRLSITTRPGITVSGNVVFQGRPPSKSPSRARISAIAADPDRDRDATFFTPGNGVIDENGRFQIRDVHGQVLFRPFPLTGTLVLNSVTLGGADITDKPYDSSNGDLGGVEIIIADQAQVHGTARNARGEAVRDYRVALFPASGKPSLLTERFMHTGSADPNGRFQIARLPAGEYLGIAVASFEHGQEWDPSFQQRVVPAARRFSLKEGQTLTIELPYVD